MKKVLMYALCRVQGVHSKRVLGNPVSMGTKRIFVLSAVDQCMSDRDVSTPENTECTTTRALAIPSEEEYWCSITTSGRFAFGAWSVHSAQVRDARGHQI